MNGTPGLFKYLSSDKLDFFEHRLVLLTPPIYLNDPWDFLPKGRAASEEEILKEWCGIESEIAKSSIIHLPADFVQSRQMLRLRQMQNWGSSQEFAEGLPRFSHDQFSSIIGVTSLTEEPLCRLMWAHYADSHAGFVAEFATRDMTKADDGRVFCSCINKPAGEVEYPPSFKMRPWTCENITDACWSKHPLWEYEHEWRILWPLSESVRWPKNAAPGAETRYCLPFDSTDLRRVIFGMRMKPGVERRLLDMLKHNDFRNVQKQRAEIDNESGELLVKALP